MNNKLVVILNEEIAKGVCQKNGIVKTDESFTWLKTLANQSLDRAEIADDIRYAQSLLREKNFQGMWEVKAKNLWTGKKKRKFFITQEEATTQADTWQAYYPGRRITVQFRYASKLGK